MVIPWLIELHQGSCLGLKVWLQVLLHPIGDGLVSMGSDMCPILYTMWSNAADAPRVDPIGPTSKIVNRSHQLEVTSDIRA